ncbi:hypothetical protein ABW20_dc0108112 [Dactylellina cionopaga]|nr:hypothetical protein ABW20_dc0108112 [Dactylellina cionopaga]
MTIPFCNEGQSFLIEMIEELASFCQKLHTINMDFTIWDWDLKLMALTESTLQSWESTKGRFQGRELKLVYVDMYAGQVRFDLTKTSINGRAKPMWFDYLMQSWKLVGDQDGQTGYTATPHRFIRMDDEYVFNEKLIRHYIDFGTYD